MAEFKFVAADGTVLDYTTRYTTIEETVVVKVKKSLWAGVGVRLPICDLNALGIRLGFFPDKSEERTNYERATAIYTAYPLIALRVNELKAVYTSVNLAFDADPSEVDPAICSIFPTEDRRNEYRAKFNMARLSLRIALDTAEKAICVKNKTTYTAIDERTAWELFPILIQWLPGTFNQSEIPADAVMEIVATEAREKEIQASLPTTSTTGLTASNV